MLIVEFPCIANKTARAPAPAAATRKPRTMLNETTYPYPLNGSVNPTTWRVVHLQFCSNERNEYFETQSYHKAYFLRRLFKFWIFSSVSFQRKEKRNKRCLITTLSQSSQNDEISMASLLKLSTNSCDCVFSFDAN